MAKFFDTERSVSGAEIKEVEERLKFTLPSSYKEHLLKYNGGRCKPNEFFFEENGKETSSGIDWILSIYHGEDRFERYFEILKIDSKRLPDSFFPFADDGLGNFICMDSSTEIIYFWDHEIEVDYSNYSDDVRDNLLFVASNLKEFLDNLK